MGKKRRVAIVGPESSGKTELSKSLAQEFAEPWAKEMSRPFLESQGGAYAESDLLKIAHLQLEEEARQWSKAKGYLFCDTNLLVIKVWAEWKYQRVDPGLMSLWKPQQYDLHLLCYPDLPYEDDPLRENPNPEDRIALFERYKTELTSLKVPFYLISGTGESRLKKAKEILDSHFTS